MTDLTRLDAWLAKHLFHPPIILVCQLTGLNQFAFYRLGWWVAVMLYIWRDDHRTIIGSTLLVVIGAIRTLSAGLGLSRPARQSLFVRVAWLIFLAFDLAMGLLWPERLQLVGISLLITFAEYATTIPTIPPRRRRDKKAKIAGRAWA